MCSLAPKKWGIIEYNAHTQAPPTWEQTKQGTSNLRLAEANYHKEGQVGCTRVRDTFLLVQGVWLICNQLLADPSPI